MQTLAFFHAKRPVTIPPKSIIIPLSDHVAVLPPPLNHGERKEKSPNCSTTLFGHCNATGTSPILGKVLNCWNCIQCRIKASSFKAGCSTLGIRSNDSIKILEPWGRMLFYILLGSVASCLMQACQVSTWDQSSSSLLHQAKGFLYLPNVGVLDLQLGRHDQCKDHLYHQRTPCFVFATKASKSAWAVEQSLLMCMWSMKSIALALLCELLLGGGFFPKPITRMNVNSVKCECQQWQQQQQQNGLQLSCGNCDHFERKRTYYQSSRCHILLSKQQQHFFHGFFNNKDKNNNMIFSFFMRPYLWMSRPLTFKAAVAFALIKIKKQDEN